MKKDLIEAFPDIFSDKIESINNWKINEEKLKNLTEEDKVAKKQALLHIKNKIMERIEDSNLKNILQQTCLMDKDLIITTAAVPALILDEMPVIDAILELHMNLNGYAGYKSSRMINVYMPIPKTSELQKLSGKRYFDLPELDLLIGIEVISKEYDFLAVFVKGQK